MGNNQVNANNNQNNNERRESLLSENQVEHDASLVVTDQPKIKKIYAIKNPVLLKRNTLQLDRDSSNRNIYYFQFNYDAVVDFDLNIYFNTKFDSNVGVIANGKNNKNNKNKNDVKIFTPSKNFVSKTISIQNCQKGQNQKFFDKSAFVDIEYFLSNKEDFEENYDVVFEMIPIFHREVCKNIREDFNLNNKDTSTVNPNQILFVTMCKLYTDEMNSSGIQISNNNLNSAPFKIKAESQRLKSQGMWIEIHEVFNSALETGECLICCVNLRNTIFLPCKHSCCCQTCSHSLRMRNNPCPICKNGKSYN